MRVTDGIQCDNRPACGILLRSLRRQGAIPYTAALQVRLCTGSDKVKMHPSGPKGLRISDLEIHGMKVFLDI